MARGPAPLLCLCLLICLVSFGPPGARAAVSGGAGSTWPHTLTENGATVTVYQPQAISWPDQKTLTARAAVAIAPPGAARPLLGTIEVTLATTTDKAAGVVMLSDPRLVATHFPTLTTEQATQLEDKIRAALPHMQTREVPLDAVLLSLKEVPGRTQVEVNNEPPVIFYSDRPASLVVFDGQPVLAPVGKTGLSFAVNTNWDIFSDGRQWYLLNNGLWLVAPSASGPYSAASRLPPAFDAIPKEPDFVEVRKHIPAQSPKPGTQLPQIFVSMKPAEIIVTAGPPQFAPVRGTSLRSVTNTASPLFLDSANGRFYYLVSGRWFSAPKLDGPWVFATTDLPPDFALIGEDSPQAGVLASVPGTVEAQEAVLKAQIPQQATLKRSEAKLTVAYAGAPQFKPIPGTSIRYAVNTPDEVLEVGGRFYACYHGAWFVSANPTGPWVLAESVPPEIYTIPPTSPVYNVTYVKVYSATPTTVTYGYTAGYAMGFLTAGVLVYGTGYYYPPVVYPGPVPIYFPYPYTYCGNVWYNSASGAWARGGTVYGPYGGAASGGTYYNPNTGAWARGGAVYGPNGGAGAWSSYNPATGRYARGSAAWGPYGGTANASFYNPRYGVSGATNQNANAYSRWGSSVVSGPNQTVHTASGSNTYGSAGGFRSTTGAAGAGYHGANGNSGGVVRTPSGDVYAGHDGNVYQRSSNGWSKWDNGSWTPTQPATGAGRQSANQGTGMQNNSLGSAQRRYGQGQTLDRSNFQQLEQDWRARRAGEGRFGAWRQGRMASFDQGRFGGERFGGGDWFGGDRFGGGERFRR